jgi:hypothetical protein
MLEKVGGYWAKDGVKFACKVDGCEVTYNTKYNLVLHLWAQHCVAMELNKLGHPST